MCEFTICVRVFPTEEPELVRNAVLALFPDAEPLDPAGDGEIAFRTDNPEHFVERLADQRIRDAARNTLRAGIGNGKLEFYLNKQAALMDRVNFTDGDSILGDIRVTVRCADPEALVRAWTAHEYGEREAEP